MKHNDKLLDYVLDQLIIDAHNGEVEPIFDLLDIVPRANLLAYLGVRLGAEVVKAGLATADEVDTDQ